MFLFVLLDKSIVKERLELVVNNRPRRFKSAVRSNRLRLIFFISDEKCFQPMVEFYLKLLVDRPFRLVRMSSLFLFWLFQGRPNLGVDVEPRPEPDEARKPTWRNSLWRKPDGNRFLSGRSNSFSRWSRFVISLVEQILDSRSTTDYSLSSILPRSSLEPENQSISSSIDFLLDSTIFGKESKPVDITTTEAQLSQQTRRTFVILADLDEPFFGPYPIEFTISIWRQFDLSLPNRIRLDFLSETSFSIAPHFLWFHFQNCSSFCLISFLS